MTWDETEEHRIHEAIDEIYPDSPVLQVPQWAIVLTAAILLGLVAYLMGAR